MNRKDVFLFSGLIIGLILSKIVVIYIKIFLGIGY